MPQKNANKTVAVKILWVPADAGGRKTVPAHTLYYPVSRFAQDADRDGEAWSVVIALKETVL